MPARVATARSLYFRRNYLGGFRVVEELRPGDPRRTGPYRLTGRLGGGGPRVIDFGISRAAEATAHRITVRRAE